MVQQITFPLEWANAIPGVSGIRDVVFAIPELSDIEDAIDELTVGFDDVVDAVLEGLDDFQFDLDIPDLDLPQIEQAIEDVLDDLDLPDLPDIRQAIDDALADVGQDIRGITLDVDELADSIADQIDVEGISGTDINIEGVFGPLREDIVRGFADVLEDVTGAVEDLPEDIDSLAAALSDISGRLADLEDAFPSDLDDDLLSGFESVLTDTLPDWATQPLEETVADLLNGLLDQAISDEAKANIEEVLP